MKSDHTHISIVVSCNFTSVNDGREPAYMKKDDNAKSFLFDTQEACCKTWFSWDSECVTSAVVSSDLYFYPEWEDSTCLRKQEHEFKYWETDDKFTTLDECCSKRFGWDVVACCNTPGMGGCAAGTDTVYTPDWTTQRCNERNEITLELWEKAFAKSTVNKCCEMNFSWDKKGCCTNSPGGC